MSKAGAAVVDGIAVAEAAIIVVTSSIGGDTTSSDPNIERINRYMGEKELIATQSTDLARGGKDGIAGITYGTNDLYTSADDAQSKLSLPRRPEVMVQFAVERGAFGAPSLVQPDFGQPGGGSERTAYGS